MTFREKSAWIMAVALTLSGIGYFWIVGSMSLAIGAVAPPLLPVAGLYVVALVAAAITGHVVAAVLAPKEADAAADERDKQIGARASQAGGMLLGVGVVLSLLFYTVSMDGHILFHGVFAALMLGQIVEYAAQIYFYRTGV
jgi:hypothetical protein